MGYKRDMHGVVLTAISAYIERPFGAYADSQPKDKLEKELEANLEYMKRFNSVLGDARRTHFFIGHHLDIASDLVGKRAIKKIYRPGDNVDIGNHTYNHIQMKELKTRPDVVPVSIDEFLEDLWRADHAIETVFGESTNVFSTPLGYEYGLDEDHLQVLFDHDFQIVSSRMRGKDDSLYVPLNEIDERQPILNFTTYYDRIVEFPSHGWQDVFKSSPATETPEAPSTDKEIQDYYRELTHTAKRISETWIWPVYLNILIHPNFAQHYDPDLENTQFLMDTLRNIDAEFVTYNDVLERVRESWENRPSPFDE
jgi:peptidoglycan/xylan/chitin deacetylase (PgdA/CDA1 family)